MKTLRIFWSSPCVLHDDKTILTHGELIVLALFMIGVLLRLA